MDEPVQKNASAVDPLDTCSSSPERNVSKFEREMSVLGGAFLLLYGLSRKSASGAALAATGGGLLVRGATGYCPVYDVLGVNTSGRDTRSSVRASRSIRVDESVTVARRPSELYDFWRRFENLPSFMKNLEAVEVIDESRSRWHAEGPLGSTVSWEAEIVNDVPGELIAWRTIDGFEVAHAGSVLFKPATGGRGAVVRVELEYSPFGGKVGGAVARLFGDNPQTQIVEDLRRFKQVMEAGEIPTVEGQPTGGSRPLAFA
jgi:uncharacterized membrane protein